jgi:hypothetical protein
MFYCNLEHTAKKAVKTRSGKVKNAATAKNRFHYITRTSHFKNYKESASEQIEFVKSGNMPSFAEGKPAEFWQAADVYERSNGRTCSSLVVALPKELSKAQRIELAEQFIAEFADRYRYPFTCAIHNHAGSIAGMEQPHLHFMYSERHVDGIERTPEQFFKRYNPKEPEKGGAQKLTADVLGMGKAQLQLYRQKTEELINASLERHAPTKIVEVRGIPVEVPSMVSCLSNENYNKKYGTQLKDVPIMNKAVRFARNNEPELLTKQQDMVKEINLLRAENNYELYQSYYQAELVRIQTAENRKKAENEAEQKRQVAQDLQDEEKQRVVAAKRTQHHALQQRYADAKKYSEYELSIEKDALLNIFKIDDLKPIFSNQLQKIDSITYHILEQQDFSAILKELKAERMIQRIQCENIADTHFIQIDLKHVGTNIKTTFDAFFSTEERQWLLQHHLQNLNEFADLINRHDERRTEVFEAAFTFQFSPQQRQELLHVFENVQAEMREFMKFYENYAEPLTERYFPDELCVVQQHIQNFKQNDQQISIVLGTETEPFIKSSAGPRLEQKHEKFSRLSNDYDGPSF